MKSETKSLWHEKVVEKSAKDDLLHAFSSDSSLQSGFPLQKSSLSTHSPLPHESLPGGQTGSSVLKIGRTFLGSVIDDKKKYPFRIMCGTFFYVRCCVSKSRVQLFIYKCCMLYNMYNKKGPKKKIVDGNNPGSMPFLHIGRVRDPGGGEIVGSRRRTLFFY